ncbi:MAG TPA: cobalamin biosynthesis protein [Pyrinomonadaceae bacterium]|nr:cobalamin biosynthesis protein [Pyrinomonadaceae bacterium]
MIYERDEEVNLLAKAFEERTLPKAEWTHAAHLVVGLYYCYHNPLGVAKNLMSDGIYWLNDAHGTPNTETSGYHETLTVFWLRTVANFLEKAGREKGLAELANELVATVNDTRLPLRFYSRERLFSVEARMNYVEPDLEDFSLSINGLVFA